MIFACANCITDPVSSASLRMRTRNTRHREASRAEMAATRMRMVPWRWRDLLRMRQVRWESWAFRFTVRLGCRRGDSVVALANPGWVQEPTSWTAGSSSQCAHPAVGSVFALHACSAQGGAQAEEGEFDSMAPVSGLMRRIFATATKWSFFTSRPTAVDDSPASSSAFAEASICSKGGMGEQILQAELSAIGPLATFAADRRYSRYRNACSAG
jgi:hypothetical protein